MKIEIITLCEAAMVSHDKLNIIGAFESVYTPAVPVTQRACTLALRMRFERIEEGDHKLRIHVIDADGHAVIPAINGEIIVRFGEEDKSCLANLFFSLGELRFANYGYYSIEFAINGRHEASLPLEVRKAIPATV